MDKNMIKLSEIMNSYSRPKIGELSINERALAEYERFCLKLIKENKKQKEVIDRIEEYIKPSITDKDDRECYLINFYVKDVLLDILKEVSE